MTRQLILDTTNGAALSYNSGLPGKDQIAKVTLEGLLDAGGMFIAGICYRHDGFSTYWLACLNRANLQVELRRVVSGVATLVAAAPWTLEDTAELMVMVQGTRHRVYLDGSALPVIDTVEDRGILTGVNVGIYAENGTGVKFKRFPACGLN